MKLSVVRRNRTSRRHNLRVRKIKKRQVRVIFLCEMGAVRSPAVAGLFTDWLREKNISGIKVESGGAHFAKEKDVELQHDVVVVLGSDLNQGLKVSKDSRRIVIKKHVPAQPIFNRVMRTIRRNFEIEN